MTPAPAPCPPDDAVVRIHAPPSPRLLRCLAPFGLLAEHAPRSPAHEVPPAALGILDAPAPNALALLNGPSGAGKSRLLAAIARTAERRGWTVITPPAAALPRARSLVDLFPNLPDAEALALLARAGLAEARLLARAPQELSTGERARLALALAMRDALHALRRGGRVLLIADEFATPLDRLTAASLAETAARWIRSAPGLRAVLAGAHEDLPALLRPDLLLTLDLSGTPELTFPGAAAPPRAPARSQQRLAPATPPRHPGIQRPDDPALFPAPPFTIEQGAIADYQALAHLHYLAARPATVTRVLRAVTRPDPSGPTILAGALVVSVPTLNGAWRSIAWPGRYATGDRRADARRLSREVRCISRVVTDPRFRARGLARRLVEHYLADPQTPRTEAVAAMGRLCPFFERAGMTAHELPPSPPDARLRDALVHAGLDPASLADAAVARRLPEDPFLAHELATWARAKRLRPADSRTLALAAARRLNAAPIAYTHDAASKNGFTTENTEGRRDEIQGSR